MESVFEEIKNITMIYSDDDTQRRKSDVMIFGGHIDTISSEDYHVLGVSNEVGKILVHEPENKYLGKKYMDTFLIKAVNYQDYQYDNILSYLYDDIVDYQTINGEIYYELIDQNLLDVLNQIKCYKKLPRRKRIYFINKKTKICSCDDNVINGECKHSKEMKLNNLLMLFEAKFGITIAKDICYSLNFI